MVYSPFPGQREVVHKKGYKCLLKNVLAYTKTTPFVKQVVKLTAASGFHWQRL